VDRRKMSPAQKDNQMVIDISEENVSYAETRCQNNKKDEGNDSVKYMIDNSVQLNAPLREYFTSRQNVSLTAFEQRKFFLMPHLL
jgi:hypothetical protein